VSRTRQITWQRLAQMVNRVLVRHRQGKRTQPTGARPERREIVGNIGDRDEARQHGRPSYRQGHGGEEEPSG
jgi:hypothetical protein